MSEQSPLAESSSSSSAFEQHSRLHSKSQSSSHGSLDVASSGSATCKSLDEAMGDSDANLDDVVLGAVSDAVDAPVSSASMPLDSRVRSRLADESLMFSHEDMPPDGDLHAFYKNQVAVKGYASDEHEETDDSDFDQFSDYASDPDWEDND